MMWTIFSLLMIGLGIGHLAHQRFLQKRQHQSQAIQGLAISQKIKTVLDALNTSGCQLELMQLFNAYLTLNLAPMMAVDPRHRPARQLAEQALQMAETKLSPNAQIANNSKTFKQIRNNIHLASQLLPQMAHSGILPGKKIQHWQVYLHQLLLEYELNYHYQNMEIAAANKRHTASDYHLNQAESLLKKNTFMDAHLQKNWESRLQTLRLSLTADLQSSIKVPN